MVAVGLLISDLASVLLLAACVGRVPAPPPTSELAPCVPTAGQRDWMQGALDGWERVITAQLAQPAQPLPWIVLFDSSCTWHLQATQPEIGRLVPAPALIAARLAFAGGPVTIHAAPHGDSVILPTTKRIAAAPVAFTSTFRGDSVTFFVMAMPEVWRQDPRNAADPFLDDFFRGVMVHELVHTRQLVGVVRRLAAIARTSALPGNLDDDAVQRRFHDDSTYVALYEQEYSLLHEAVLAATSAERRRLAARALAIARDRRARFFVGPDSIYRDLEDLFLYLEGSAGWAFFQVARSRMPAGTTLAEALAKLKGSRRFWVQEEGGLLFLMIDAEVPEWKARAFRDEPVSVFDLWAEAAGVPLGK